MSNFKFWLTIFIGKFVSLVVLSVSFTRKESCFEQRDAFAS